jgi:hypothetical protein
MDNSECSVSYRGQQFGFIAKDCLDTSAQSSRKHENVDFGEALSPGPRLKTKSHCLAPEPLVRVDLDCDFNDLLALHVLK